MQAQTVRVRVRVRFWFIALYVLLLAFNNCDSHQHQNKHKHKNNHNKARSKYTTQQSFDDKPEGKIFGWKKQPQTQIFFITRPPTLPTAPLPVTATTTVFTSPVPTAPTAPAAPATVTTLRRPYAQRYGGGGGGGGYRRIPVRRQNVRQGQGYRTQRPWNRRRVWAYGREDEAENVSPSNVDGEVETDDSGQQSLVEDERDVEVEVGLKEGVSAKLDIEQLGKAILSQQDTHIDNDAGQIAVVADDLNKVYKQRLKVKSKRPQTAAILATTATDVATSNEPTYANIVVHSNSKTKNTKKKVDGEGEGEKRPTIWQGIRKAWRERRERQKNAALKKKEEQQQQQEEAEIENVDGENEIFIDENGEIHIRRRKTRRKNNNRNRQQNTREQQLNIKSKQKKKRRQQEVEDEEEVTNNENSVISENNTNSRFQNIMNAFRRTPIIYKQHSR